MNKVTSGSGLKELVEKIAVIARGAKRYSLVIFIVFVGVIYGYVYLRINTLSNAQPSQDSVSSQVKAAKLPHIDQTVVQQLKSLQDNSVSVKSLFNETRNNPFQ